MDAAREIILGNVRSALKRDVNSPVAEAPRSRPAARTPGEVNAELDLLLMEVGALGGVGRRIAERGELRAALAELVQAEAVKKAIVWPVPELEELRVGSTLSSLGVELVSPYADKREVAACELGVTAVDAALPETGTILLRGAPDRPRYASLLPRVHLAILTPAALRADLHQALGEVKGERYFVLVTGPSRTADIELTLAIGVHGPKSLYVWALA